MEELGKIADAIEIRKQVNKYFGSVTGCCNWFNEFVKNKCNNLSEDERKNHTVDMDLIDINYEIFEKDPHSFERQLKKGFVAKLEQAGWQVFYTYYKEESIPTFYWNNSFEKDTNTTYAVICASEMKSYEYYPSKKQLINDSIYNKRGIFPFKYNESYSLLNNFVSWFNKLTDYKQTHQRSDEKVGDNYVVDCTDVPSYFLTSQRNLALPIITYLNKFHWEVTYDNDYYSNCIYFKY